MVKIQKEHLAIASVPVQSWGELYNQDDALKTGTIFKELDLPFFAAEQIRASEFYPLTMDCMEGIYERDPSSTCYCWQEGPIPWEGVCY